MALITGAVAISYVPKLAEVDTTQLNLLLEVATAQIETLCNRKFAASDYHEKQTGDGSRETFIKNPPILRFDSVEYLDTDDVKYALSGTDFKYQDDTGQVKFKTVLSTGADFDNFAEADLQNITINYRGGYATIPNDLAYVIACWTYALYQESQAAIGVKSESLQEYSYTNSDAITLLPPTAQQILNLYRLIDPL